MTRRVTFSEEHLTFEDVAAHHEAMQTALRFYFANTPNPRFVGYTRQEIDEELSAAMEETDKSSSLTILAAIEAILRIDYLRRCYEKDRDEVSVKMRSLYKKKGERASLEEEILGVWREEQGFGPIVSNAVGALKYRHWLAHGRYWVPKLGRKYDFDFLYTLANEIAAKLAA